MQNEWDVGYSSKADKQKKNLPNKIQNLLALLVKEIELQGPLRSNWPNFSPLKKDKGIPKDAYHCHLKRGKPTYVACWYIEDKKIKIVEVFYVGTHEKAPY
jgi:hypothetical protein